MARTGKSTRRRPAHKRREVIDTLRRQIVSGRYAPGDRLPTRAEIERSHKVSWITVQHAFEELQREGFVTPRGGADQPPHLHRFALVFCNHPSHWEWSLRWAAMEQAIPHVTAARPVQIKTYYDVTGHTDEESLNRLHADVAAGRLAGVIFASPPYWLSGFPESSLWRMPRVSLSKHHVAGAVTVCPGPPDFLDRALDHVAERGCRRVACVGVGGSSQIELSPEQVIERVERGVAARGMTTRPGWTVPVAPFMPITARYVLRLMMEAPSTQRPDALLVTDDHVLEQATRGLAEAGLDAAQHVTVVSQVNFPLLPPSCLPVTRIGADANELLHTALDVLQKQKRGEPVPDATPVAVHHESELPAAPARSPAASASPSDSHAPQSI